MKPILEIHHISKKFRIDHEQQSYLSIRDSVSTLFKKKNSKEDFWALKDVSFNVEAGDTLGIIGKNGAGKSTLLKILSKITPPTSGKIIGRGRIASLLEVGTGFHPELSGRENIFMNGSILGMRRAEILKNFDVIVDFAGVEKFIDTPLKHYSSGMQLRLAFAVAAFLENEILIIDEVLAVGDAEFQKKCLGKMSDISTSGRTILFVSHNMGAISKLCKKSIYLNDGNVVTHDMTPQVINVYLSNSESKKDYCSDNEKAKEIYISKCFISKQKDEFGFDEIISLSLSVKSILKNTSCKIGVALLDNEKNKIFTHHFQVEILQGKTLDMMVSIPSNTICPGNYSVDMAVFNPNIVMYDYVSDICPFKIVDTGSDYYYDQNFGKVFVNCDWKII